MSAPVRNEVVYGAGFFRDVQKLQHEVQEKLAELLDVLARDAFEFSGQHTIKLLVADHRNRIYKRLARL